MNLPLSVYKRLPKRMPLSIGFKRYAMYFDGSSYYVEVLDSPELNSSKFVVEVFVKLSEIPTSGWHSIVSKHDSGKGFTVEIDAESDNRFEFTIGDGSSFGSGMGESLSNYQVNRWYHITAVYDGTQQLFYRNGILRDTLTRSYVSSTINLHVGNSEAYGNYFHGVVALVREYNEDFFTWLSSKGWSLEKAIRYNMLNYHNPIKTGLVLWLHDKIVGSTWYDESGYGNNGTINGATKQNLSMWELRTEVGL